MRRQQGLERPYWDRETLQKQELRFNLVVSSKVPFWASVLALLCMPHSLLPLTRRESFSSCSKVRTWLVWVLCCSSSVVRFPRTLWTLETQCSSGWTWGRRRRYRAGNGTTHRCALFFTFRIICCCSSKKVSRKSRKVLGVTSGNSGHRCPW